MILDFLGVLPLALYTPFLSLYILVLIPLIRNLPDVA